MARLIKKREDSVKLRMKKKLQLTIEIPRVIRDYNEQLQASKTTTWKKWTNSQKGTVSLDRNQEERENINRLITSTEIEIMIKNFPTNKHPGPDGFTGKFYQTFREELTHIPLKLFQKVAEGGKPPSSIYEVTISLIPKPDKAKL